MLHQAFFSPWRAIREGGFDPIIRGMISGQAKKSDPQSVMSEELREKLFQLANKSGFDLASLNMQRSRDHGLPLYREWKTKCEELCGTSGTVANLGYSASTPYITDQTVVTDLLELYGTLDNIDIWIAGLLEEVVPGARVGPTFQCLLAEQFQRLRNGDRFYYEGHYSQTKIDAIESFTMSKLICLTTGIERVPTNAFIQGAPSQLCSQLNELGLLAEWREESNQLNCGIPPSPQDGLLVILRTFFRFKNFTQCHVLQ